MAAAYTCKRFDSTRETVSKFVFEFSAPDAVAEAVLYRYYGYRIRTVVCCSVQSGCPVGCTFCGSGGRFVRNLTAEEILLQVRHLLDREVIGCGTEEVAKLQIMFMSMGEPGYNPEGVQGAVRMLSAEYPNAELLISTVCPGVDMEWLIDLAVEVPAVGFQASVHESTDAGRNALIPLIRKLNLEEIASYGERWALMTGRRPFFNYCAHRGNSGVEDAARLRAVFDPAVWCCTVSVICTADESMVEATRREREAVSGLAALMSERGFDVRVFDPAGQDDIGGGCGQLWYTQRWMEEHGR